MKTIHIGLLPEDAVRRNVEKLMRLMAIRKELRTKPPATPVEEVCRPIQKEAVNREIRNVIRYLRKWRVNIRMQVNNND